MGRLSREVIVTEKIDGTNAQIYVWDERSADPASGPEYVARGSPPEGIPFLYSSAGFNVAAGSRQRWITPTDDNFGFARWVLDRAPELSALGHGRHFGEWWGSGIQRGYGLRNGDKRFSTFNVSKWHLHGDAPKVTPTADPRMNALSEELPPCVGLVPVLGVGVGFDVVDSCLFELARNGSRAAPGFSTPEGIVAFHTAGQVGFKKTLIGDSSPKGQNV